jgi:hypothetical protein
VGSLHFASLHFASLHFASLLVVVVVGSGCSSSGSLPSGPSDAGTLDGGDRGDGGVSTHANGTLGPWQTLTPMPVRRANFCAVAVGEHIVVIGGDYDADGGFVRLDEIDVARAGSDGTVSTWSVAGKTPSPLQQCTVAAAGTTLYLLDGIYDDTTKGGQVFSATLSAEGTLSAWANVVALPPPTRLISQTAWTVGDVLVAIHSDTDDVTRALHASISAGLTPWSDSPWLPEFRGAAEWAHTPGFTYVVGGYADADAGNAVLTSGWGASVAADGSFGTPFALPKLATPTTYGSAVGVDEWVFVLGGRDGVFGGAPSADVFSAQAGADGKLGAWASQAAMPAGRTNFAVVAGGDYVYALGGASALAASAADTVFAARARF